MKALVRWAVYLYPAPWRERYGKEFHALLEDATPRGWDLWDVLREAFHMRLNRLTFATITIAFVLAGGLIAGTWSLLLPKQYVSTAVVRARIADPAREPLGVLYRAEQAALIRRSLSEIV